MWGAWGTAAGRQARCDPHTPRHIPPIRPHTHPPACRPARPSAARHTQRVSAHLPSLAGVDAEVGGQLHGRAHALGQVHERAVGEDRRVERRKVVVAHRHLQARRRRRWAGCRRPGSRQAGRQRGSRQAAGRQAAECTGGGQCQPASQPPVSQHPSACSGSGPPPPPAPTRPPARPTHHGAHVLLHELRVLPHRLADAAEDDARLQQRRRRGEQRRQRHKSHNNMQSGQQGATPRRHPKRCLHNTTAPSPHNTHPHTHMRTRAACHIRAPCPAPP